MIIVQICVLRLYQPLTRSIASLNHASTANCATSRSLLERWTRANTAFLTLPSDNPFPPFSKSANSTDPGFVAVNISITTAANVRGRDMWDGVCHASCWKSADAYKTHARSPLGRCRRESVGFGGVDGCPSAAFRRAVLSSQLPIHLQKCKELKAAGRQRRGQ